MEAPKRLTGESVKWNLTSHLNRSMTCCFLYSAAHTHDPPDLLLLLLSHKPPHVLATCATFGTRWNWVPRVSPPVLPPVVLLDLWPRSFRLLIARLRGKICATPALLLVLWMIYANEDMATLDTTSMTFACFFWRGNFITGTPTSRDHFSNGRQWWWWWWLINPKTDTLHACSDFSRSLRRRIEVNNCSLLQRKAICLD